ncbi:MAG TPA: hypothetical protein DEA94_02180 [Rhodobacteraceae bacterium]|nr:hypothetical protein [Paracoccaceae bacterium]
MFCDPRCASINNGFDLAIRTGPKAKNSATSRRLCTVKHVLVASKTYISRRPVVQGPKGLTDWEWLALAQVQIIPLEFIYKLLKLFKSNLLHICLPMMLKLCIASRMPVLD